MASALAAALAAPLYKMVALIGAGSPTGSEPAAALAEIRDLLADVSAALRTDWSHADDEWSGAGADGAAEFVGGVAQVADRLSSEVDELRVRAGDAARAVERARSRLRDIVNRFEDRVATLEARLDEPGVQTELRADAQRAVDEATAVVDELREELDGHTAAVAAAPTPPALPASTPPALAAPTAPAGFSAPGGFSTAGWGGMPAPTSGGFAPLETDLSSLTVPEPDDLDGGVAVTLPDGSTVTAPNAVAASAVRHALTQLGVPYVWGGTTPGVGLDCSGLTQWAYHEAGLDLPRLAQEQDLGAAVGDGSLKPGDLAVWDGHVAMIVGNGMMIEAGDPVQLSPIRTTNAGQGFQGFWRPTA